MADDATLLNLLGSFIRAGAYARYQTTEAVLCRRGLTWNEWSLMWELRYLDQPIETRVAAHRVGITRPALVQLLRKLQDERNLVQGHRHLTLKGFVYLELSTRGVKVFDELLPAVEREAAYIFSRWPEDKRDDLRYAMLRMIARLDSEQARERRDEDARRPPSPHAQVAR